MKIAEIKKAFPADLPLGESESARLYWELGRRGAPVVGKKSPWAFGTPSEEELLALALQQSRYDPRLLAILVSSFSRGNIRINPVNLKAILRQQALLPVMGVVAEFALCLFPSIETKDLLLFLTIGARPVPIQLFYRNLYPLGGSKMREAIEQPLWGFKKWGFLAADPPILKENHPSSGRLYLWDGNSRKNLLKDFARQQARFRLKDYLREVGNSISRQQALKDVSANRQIVKRGKGKGTSYYWKSG